MKPGKTPCIVLLLLLLAGLAGAQSLLKSPQACYNTASTNLGNLAFGKAGAATDGNISTSTAVDLDGFIIDLNASYPITSWYIKGSQTASCAGGDVFTISASTNGTFYTTVATTNPFSVIEPLEQSKNITPSNYRYWNVTRSRATNCGDITRLVEIQLNASPQTCFPNFFQLINYTNSTSWMAVYNLASLNQSTNANRVVLEENNSNGNLTEIEDKFSNYGHQYVVMAAYNATLNEAYSAHKTTITNGQCRKTNVKKIALGTHAITTVGIDSGLGELGHFMVAGFGAGYAYMATSQKDDCASGTGGTSWKIFRVTLATNNVQSWINESTDFNAHYYLVRDTDYLDFLTFDLNIERKQYYWSINSTNLSTVYSATGARSHQAYFVDGGKSVVFSSNRADNKSDLYLVPEDCNASCTAQRLTFTPENESIKSVLDIPERKMFVVAYNNTVSPFSVFAQEFYTAPFSSKASVNSTVAGSPALFSVFWQAAYNVSHYIFSTNNSGSWVNDSVVAFPNAPDGWSNVTKVLNSTPGSVVGWKVYANDSRGKWSVTEQQVMTTDAKPPTFANPSHNSTRAGQSTRFTVDWSDDGNLSSYVFSFDNGTGNFTNDSSRNFSGTSALSDVTKKLSDLAGVVTRWLVYAWDATNNSNSTPVQSFTTVEATAPAISLEGSSPTSTNAFSIFFNFTASDASALQTATLFANFSGSWAANASNSSVLLNASSNSITVSGIPEGNFVWNVRVCDANGNCAFASTNNSLRVDRTRPNATAPSVQASSSSAATFSWTANENSTGIVEYWTGSNPPTNSTNSTQSSSLSVAVSSLSPRTTYNYRTWTCDEAGNCVASETNSFLSGGAGNELSTPSGGGGFFAAPATATPTPAAETNTASAKTSAAGQAQAINAIAPTPGQLPPPNPATVSPSIIPTPIQEQNAGSTPSANQAPFTGRATAGINSLDRNWLVLFLVLLAVALAFALTHFSKKREEPPVKREDFNPPTEIQWIEWK